MGATSLVLNALQHFTSLTARGEKIRNLPPRLVVLKGHQDDSPPSQHFAGLTVTVLSKCEHLFFSLENELFGEQRVF